MKKLQGITTVLSLFQQNHVTIGKAAADMFCFAVSEGMANFSGPFSSNILHWAELPSASAQRTAGG